jgi:hypothetical protein
MSASNGFDRVESEALSTLGCAANIMTALRF